MIPNVLSKQKIPDSLPVDMRKSISLLKKSKSKEQCLKNAYAALTERYRGRRIMTYTRIFSLAKSDINEMWDATFLHCTKLNYLLRILLVKSGLFKDADIEMKWSLIWFISPHQYVRIKLDDRYVNVDIWGAAHGIRFGDYARGFH